MCSFPLSIVYEKGLGELTASVTFQEKNSGFLQSRTEELNGDIRLGATESKIHIQLEKNKYSIRIILSSCCMFNEQVEG